MMLLAAMIAVQAPAQPSIAVTPLPSVNARIRSGRIADSEYPRSALRARIEGRTTVRFQVGINGRVSNCEVEVTSGDAALDTTTCTIAQRFAFSPARDAGGQIVPQWFRFAIRYSLPRLLTVAPPVPVLD